MGEAILHESGLAGLSRLRDYRSRRVSSFDPSGGNRDWIDIEPGQRRVFADLAGPGCIRHIWMTLLFKDDRHLRRVVLRMTWDGCAEPSVECPIGDFFGLGHAMRKDFHTAVMSMSPQDGRAFNSWWPMPFRSGARLEIDNSEGEEKFPFYFYVDYEAYDSPAALDGHGCFHVQWRRENPTQGWGDEYEALRKADWNAWARKTWHGGDARSLNVGGEDNYVILDAIGDGIYCGAHLDIDIFERQKNDWYGEGDDMVFIDGDAKPTLHGTGTEDWCNTAFGPHTEFVGPYHGILLYNGTPEWKWRGKQSIYRYYIEDPIRFHQSIRATIEHGHANKLANDYASTAYFYLSRPARGGPALPPWPLRLPRAEERYSS